MNIIYIPDNQDFIDCIPKELRESYYRNRYQLGLEYDSTFELKQLDEGLYGYIPKLSKVQTRVVAFDLDWTLAYSEKALYPRDPEDIHILPERQFYLHRLLVSGYTLAIFTNQTAKSTKEISLKLQRVQNFLRKLKLPVYTFVATNEKYKKPNTGMYEAFAKVAGKNPLYFTGDALGRPQDFSDSDLVFGKRINAIVIPPEEFFPPTFYDYKYRPETKEMIVLVGAQGVGKTTFASRLSRTHVKISKDDYPGKKFLNRILEVLKTGKSVVIDSTGGKRHIREDLYDLAEEHGYYPRVVYITRNGYGWNALREKKVPDIAYHTFYKSFENPSNDGVVVERIWW